MTETQQLFADLIDSFGKAWTRPEHWLEDRTDDLAAAIRDYWAVEREKWASNLLGIIQTWMRFPEDGPDADDEQGLQSWAQIIAEFKANMALGAETVEMEIVRMLDAGDGEA